MNEHYYLYALTWANCPKEEFGAGVDPRYSVEPIRYGQLAALTSRVGLDQFDLAKLQEGTADVPWMGKVAVRHNEVINAVARHLPVLPMRLGILFESRSSLIAKLAPYESNAAEFLRRLEDRREWAVKVYVDEDRAGKAIRSHPPHPRTRAPLADYLPVRAGTEYLAGKVERLDGQRQVDAMVRHAVLTVEARLKHTADSWQRLRSLPQVLTHRWEKMVWNAAFLLAGSTISSFQTACERLRSELAPKGLIVEVTGPWPPYHFCPTFESPSENSPCRCTC